MHDALTEERYVASRPDTANGKPYPYIRYVEPRYGRILGRLNSKSFTFIGQGTKRDFGNDSFAEEVPDGVRFNLVSDEAVAAITDIAAQRRDV